MPWYITAHTLPPADVELVFFYPDGHREAKKLVEDEVYIGNGKYKDTAPTHWAYPNAGDLPAPPPVTEEMSSSIIQAIQEDVKPKRAGD